MKVQSIINPEAKTGFNAKGQKWSTSQVELEDESRVYIFNPIEVGDEVESYTTEKDGRTFTNWRKKKTTVTVDNSAELATIINMLITINGKLDKLMGVDDKPVELDDFYS
jgi:hypothetical protein